jgi:autotransporter-associated beta strand protein
MMQAVSELARAAVHGRQVGAARPPCDEVARDHTQGPCFGGRGCGLRSGVSTLAFGAALVVMGSNTAEANCGTIAISLDTASCSGGAIISPTLTNLAIGTIDGPPVTIGGSAPALYYGGSVLGSLSNNGTISGVTTGFHNAGTIGTLSNSGKILGSWTALRNSGQIGTLNNNSTGVISGSVNGISNSGVVGGATIGQLTNSGSISSVFNGGNGVIGAMTVAAGIANSAFITIISNSGAILGETTGVRNSGTIGSIGTLLNAGLITGGEYAIYNSGEIGTLNNNSGGHIEGIQYGIDNGGSIGTLSNSGSISSVFNWGVIGTGASDAAFVNSGSIGTLLNTGTICACASGADEGIENTGRITLLNNSGGTITGITGVDNSGTIGTLSNSGTITGSLAALDLAGGSLGPVTNSGVIAGNIENATTNGLTISGGTGTIFGTLTGASGSIRAADQGTISSSAAGVTFTSGNLLLNDTVAVPGQTVFNTGATLLLDNPVTIATSGSYVQTGGALVFTAPNGTSGYSYLTVGLNATVNNSNISIVGNGLAAGQSFTIVRANGIANYIDDTALVGPGLAGILSTPGLDLVVTLETAATWDGATTTGDGTVHGSSGTWSETGTNWTTSDGAANGSWLDGDTPTFAGTAGTVTVNDSAGTIAVGGMNFETNGYVLQGDAIQLTNASSTFTVDSGLGAAIASGLTGTGGLDKAGTGTLVLTGTDSYAGGTDIAAGTLQLGDGGTSGTIAGNVVDDGTLLFDRSDSLTFGGSISGSGSVVQQGTGTLTLTGTNGYSGGTTITGGTLAISSDGNLGASTGTVTLDGGTLQTTADIDSARNVVLGSSGTFDTDGNASTISGTMSGSGNLTVASSTGSGTLTLTGANTSYTGATTIDNGATLALSGSGSVEASSGVTDNGTFDISGTSGASITSLAGTGTVSLGGETLTLTNADGTFGGVISGTGGGLTLAAGSETLTNVNTYTGTTTIDSGATLALMSADDITLDNVVDYGTLSVAGTISGLSGTGSVNVGSPGLVLLGGGTFAGTLAGAGGVMVGSGTQTLTLTGNNTYTGTTTINGGATLALSGSGSVAASSGVTDNGTFDISGTSGASITSLAGTGAVNLGGETLTLTNANGTFGGVISGAGGGLTLAAGTETLTNVSTYTGTTTIDSGATLALLSADDITLGNVVDYGTLSIAGAIAGLSGTGSVNVGSAGLVLTGSGTFAGTLAGASGVTVGSGTQTLTGNNTYTGATTIDSGATLALSGAGSIAASSGVNDDGVLDVSNTAAGASIANLSGSGTVNLGSQMLTLANAGGTFGGSFSGSGKLLLSGGTGSLILDGNSSAFTGTTEIASGLLEVGDLDNPQAELGGNVQVDSSGTLRGHGTVEGSVTNNGTVMPGGSVGTLTVGGNYTQAGNATLAIEVKPAGASQLNVSGSATLAGTLAITYDPGTYSATTYKLVSAGSVTGTFGNTTSTGEANLGGLTPSLGYTATAVDLTLAASSSTSPVVVAPTGTSIYTALGTTAILGAQAQSTTLLDQMQHASAATPATPNGWVTATGILTKVDGTNGEPGFQANRYGFLAGLDHKLGDYTVGVAAGYDHADIDESGTGDSGTTDTLRAALYGSRFVGPVNLAATAGVGLDFLSQKRPFGAQGTAEGDHMGQEANLGGQASLPMTFGSVTVTPRLGLRYAYFHANGFGESGAGAEDLSVGTDNVHSLQPYAGVTLDKVFGDASRPTTVQLRLGYARELLDANRAMSVMSQDGTLFTAPGTNLPRGYLTTGASVTLHPMKNLDVSLSYDTVINTGHASEQQGSVRLGYQF